MPKVSVCIACYNHEKYIGPAIRSVLEQSFQDFEIVILDNGSTDSSLEVINSFKDTRLSVKHIDKNQQSTYAGNDCISRSSGEYIALLCSDDLWEPDKLQKQVEYLDRNKNAGAVFSRVQPVSKTGGPITSEKNPHHRQFNIQPNRTRHEWLSYMFYSSDHSFCCSSALVRKECFDKLGLIDIRARQMQDFLFWADVCMNYDVFILEEKLTRARFFRNKSNLSGLNKKVLIATLNETYMLFEKYKQIADFSEFLKIFPETSKLFSKVSQQYIPFYLSLLALFNTETPNLKPFALNHLYDFFDDEINRRSLEEDFGFTHMDLYEISEKQNSFDSALNLSAPVVVSERKKGYYINVFGLLKTKIWPKKKITKKSKYIY